MNKPSFPGSVAFVAGKLLKRVIRNGEIGGDCLRSLFKGIRAMGHLSNEPFEAFSGETTSNPIMGSPRVTEKV